MVRIAEELALMVRGTVALFIKGANVEPLIDADHELELSRNTHLAAAPPERQEQFRKEYAGVVSERLRLLRRNIGRSFLVLLSAVVAASILAYFVAASPSGRVWLATSSVFCFAWATLARLGWAGHSFGGDSIVERLDERIFRAFYWIATFLGTLALV